VTLFDGRYRMSEAVEFHILDNANRGTGFHLLDDTFNHLSQGNEAFVGLLLPGAELFDVSGEILIAHA
jgi:hypothetical protein